MNLGCLTLKSMVPPLLLSTYIPFSHGSRGLESVSERSLGWLHCARWSALGRGPETGELVLALYCLAV